MAKAAAALIDLDGLARRIRSLPAGMGAFATRDGCARRGGRSLVHDRDRCMKSVELNLPQQIDDPPRAPSPDRKPNDTFSPCLLSG